MNTPSTAEAANDSVDPSVREKALQRLFSRISDVSTLPTVAQRVVQLAGDESSSAEDLYDVIRTDPALVARILRRLNSSYYGLSNRVADLQTAVSLLGFREIRNLALTVFVSRMAEERSPANGYSREAMWAHSVAVAATARLVSRVCGRSDPGEAYVGGLLHDIGLLLLDQHLRKHFSRVVEQIDEETPTCDVEEKVFTFNHAELGAFVAKKWCFAEQISDCIEYHHHPHRYEGPHKDIVNVVAIANYLCSRAGWTSLSVHNVEPPSDQVYAGVGLDQTGLAAICEKLPETLEQAGALATS